MNTPKKQLSSLLAAIILMLTLINTVASQTSNSPVCNDDPINLFCGGVTGCGIAGSTYNWFNSDHSWTSTAKDPVIYPGPGHATGTFYVSVHALPNSFYGGSVAVVVLPQIILSATVSPVTCPTGHNGSILLQVSGGMPPYYYLWSTSASTIGISGLDCGTYTVTVMDMNNCKATGSWNVSTDLAIAGTIHPASCSPGNDAWIDLSVSGSCTPFTYHWSNGSSTQDISGLTCGNVYTVTVTDVSCGKKTASWLYEDLLLNAVVHPATGPGCDNGSIDLSVSCGIPPYTYHWDNGPLTQDISGLSPGNYCVTVTDAYNSAKTCCWTVGAGSDHIVVCYGDPVYLYCCGLPGCGMTGAIYTWMNLSGTWTSSAMNPVIPSATVSDNYYLTIQYPPAGLSSGVYHVTVLPQIILTATVLPVTCPPGNNGSISVQTSGGTPMYTYQWSSMGSASVITGLGCGIYTVTVTDANNCKVIGSWKITTDLKITATIHPATCSPGNDAWIHVSATGGCTPYTYLWDNSLPYPDLPNVICGNTYCITVTDALCGMKTGCWLYEDVILNAVVQPASGAYCNDGYINLSVLCGTPQFTYHWSNGPITQNNSGLTAGTYCVTVTDAHNISRICCWPVSHLKSTCQSNYLQNMVITNGMNTCYDAAKNIFVAGNGSGFIVQNGGRATMIAGEMIDYLPGTSVEPNGYMHGYIAPSGPYCSGKMALLPLTVPDQDKPPLSPDKLFFKIYPNPTTGGFSIDLNDSEETADLRVEIYGMYGERVFSAGLKGMGKYDLSLEGKPVGIYFIRIVTGKLAGTGKIIKQ